MQNSQTLLDTLPGEYGQMLIRAAFPNTRRLLLDVKNSTGILLK